MSFKELLKSAKLNVVAAKKAIATSKAARAERMETNREKEIAALKKEKSLFDARADNVKAKNRYNKQRETYRNQGSSFLKGFTRSVGNVRQGNTRDIGKKDKQPFNDKLRL